MSIPQWKPKGVLVKTAPPSSIALDAPPTPQPDDSLLITNQCTPQDTTSNVGIELQIEIDSRSSGSSFLQALSVMAGKIVSHGEFYFALCPKEQIVKRLLVVVQDQITIKDPKKVDDDEIDGKLNDTVTGLEAVVSPSIIIGGKFKVDFVESSGSFWQLLLLSLHVLHPSVQR